MSPILFLMGFIFIASILLAAIGLVVDRKNTQKSQPRFVPYVQVLNTFAYQKETRTPPTP